MKNDPLVSIVMPVYNTQKYVGEAIESILNQTYKNFEFIIINDGSTDKSWEIIQKYAKKDKRVKALRSKKNLGIAKARNKGLKISRGKYYAPMDSDDISKPERIEKEVRFLETNPEYALVGSDIGVIDKSSKIIGKRVYPKSYSQIIKSITAFNPFAQSSLMIKKEAMLLYCEDYSGCEDYHVWLKILSKNKGANIPKILTMYRISNEQTKSKKLKESILLTLSIQRMWLFKNPYFNPLNIIKHIIKYPLILLPSNVVYKVFTNRTYNK